MILGLNLLIFSKPISKMELFDFGVNLFSFAHANETSGKL
jgi:hypothetical protein